MVNWFLEIRQKQLSNFILEFKLEKTLVERLVFFFTVNPETFSEINIKNIVFIIPSLHCEILRNQ
ncbi:hypothetical protein B0A66_11515 [Flavobacterium hercynium]|uniref:Uncharacterized protein n=1 Tax=Flavobacterium hercynium TaxID=387094 RepID=A0A226HA92_9FLAO|nr:hypothetical protein B0A66_11515 [Flavobacterium hercynium]